MKRELCVQSAENGRAASKHGMAEMLGRQPPLQPRRDGRKEMMMANHLYESNGKLHACEMKEIHPGIRLVWTKCGKDVPANKSFRSRESATCEACKTADREG